MQKQVRWTAVLTALALATVPAACGGDDGGAQAEIDREMDLALAQSDSATLADIQRKIDEEMEAREPAGEVGIPAEKPAAQPSTAAKPVDRTPAPVDRTPAPAEKPAPKPEYTEHTVAQGTRFQMTLDQELSTRNSMVGDLFTATVTTPLTDGSTVVVPAGTRIRGEVTQASASGGSGKPAVLKVRFTDFTVAGQTYPIGLTITEATVETRGRDNTGDKALKIGAGAAAGALIGQLIGKNTGATLAGAAVGAAAGTGFQMTTEDVDAILREGSTITVETDAPVTVRKKLS
jgi:hypothetical protein